MITRITYPQRDIIRAEMPRADMDSHISETRVRLTYFVHKVKIAKMIIKANKLKGG